jgi:probable addiction module antidote protein
MAKTYRSHDDATIEMFRKDPSLAADYLNDVLASGDEVDLMMALRYLSNAFGGVQEIARRADANPNTMYRTLSEQGNPSLKTLLAILSSMGLRLAVQPAETSES